MKNLGLWFLLRVRKMWIFKHYKILIALILVIANFAFFAYQNNKIKNLKSQNESLKAEIYSKENEITELNSVILNQNTTIDEMAENSKAKENLNKELKSIREQILKDLKQNDEIIDQPLRDSVDFIIARLREKNANNQ